MSTSYDALVNMLESIEHQLTQGGARMTAVEILKVIHFLVQNMNIVMDGEQTRSPCHPPFIEHSSL
jgi:hypothetical protein